MRGAVLERRRHGGYRAGYNLSPWNGGKKIAGFGGIGYEFRSFTLWASCIGNDVDIPRT